MNDENSGEDVRVALLGLVVATERQPTTPHEFRFWTALDASVGIGTIVRVEGTHPVNGVIPRVFGVVTEGFGYTDLQSPLHDVLGHDGSPERASLAATERTEIRLYTASVLRQVPEEPLQPVPMGQVYLADDADVATALRMDSFLKSGTGIPVGVYRSGGVESPVFLDADFLLGPEAAHLSISGVSGLATKTSAVEWLLASLFAHFPEKKGSVAAVCFNVKGPDLCFLDLPNDAIDDADRALYDRLNVPATPFGHVEYYAPRKAQGNALNTLRSNEALLHNVHPLTWGLREVLDYAEVLLNRDDVDAKADALIDFVRERLVGKRYSDPQLLGSKQYEVRTFSQLEEWFRDVLSAMEQKNNEGYKTHHVATIRKVRNRLINISQRCAGLVTDEADVSDLPFGSFEDRTVYVVDVANLEEDAQDLIFARVVTKLREGLERRDLGVKHVVVFVDELNKYAPSDGQDTYVRKMLLDLAERGRYLGLVLFGAQQFRSQVHRRVVGNSGTSLFGRMDADELATPGYAVLSPAIRTKLATLDKGQLMVRHPHFTQPVFVRFPRPAVMQGREGAEQYPQGEEPTLERTVLADLRRLDPSITLGEVQDAIGIHDEVEIRRALSNTRRSRPEKVMAFFKSQFRGVLTPRAAAVTQPAPAIRALSDDDPYGF